MSTSTTIIADNSLLSRGERGLFALESLLNFIGGVTIFLLVLLAAANAIGRWAFNQPVIGYIDWVEQAMAVFAFFGIAYCQRLGGHIRMDILLAQLRGRSLWLAEFTATLFMLLITAVLVYGSYLHFYRAFANGDSSMDIGLPTWPAKLVVPLALTVLAMRLLLQLWAYARAMLHGGAHPVAVPLIEDAATQANREAQSLEGNARND